LSFDAALTASLPLLLLFPATPPFALPPTTWLRPCKNPPTRTLDFSDAPAGATAIEGVAIILFASIALAAMAQPSTS
jgi:hypothetical protein